MEHEPILIPCDINGLAINDKLPAHRAHQNGPVLPLNGEGPLQYSARFYAADLSEMQRLPSMLPLITQVN
ncbi:hypothetical protein D3C73_1487830 [compost metagenome]